MKDKSFLATAKAQLDSDHFGLEKIKKRLIEYLAVVRLKELNVEREAQEERAKAEAEAAAHASSQAHNEANASPEENSGALVLRDKSQPETPQVATQIKRPVKKSVKGPILL